MLDKKISTSFQDDTLDVFRELLHREAALAAKEGIHVPPYKNAELPHFNQLSAERKREVIGQVSETLTVYDEMLRESLSLRDNSQLLWRCMRRLKLTPANDLFDKITGEDTIVVFGSDNRQIFRNLEFLRHSILTLEELYTTEWYRYTRRDQKIVDQGRELMSNIFAGKRTGTFNPDIEEHVIEQVSDTGTGRLRIQIDYVSPLTSDRKIVGVVVIERVWPVDEDIESR